MRQALIVFAKVPRPGTVKTRLTPVLTEEDAARLYEAFLRDALAQYGEIDAEVRLYMPPFSDAMPSGLVPTEVDVFAQQGEGLGARMHHAFIETFAAGFERVVIIGTDHPSLPSAFIEQAFSALKEPLSICLGPSEDGGYYLLGMNDFFPGLFEGMTYSHDAVFQETMARAGATRATITILPEWYDVDTPADLERLALDLGANAQQAPHTRQVLSKLDSWAGTRVVLKQEFEQSQ